MFVFVPPERDPGSSRQRELVGATAAVDLHLSRGRKIVDVAIRLLRFAGADLLTSHYLYVWLENWNFAIRELRGRQLLLDI